MTKLGGAAFLALIVALASPAAARVGSFAIQTASASIAGGPAKALAEARPAAADKAAAAPKPSEPDSVMTAAEVAELLGAPAPEAVMPASAPSRSVFAQNDTPRLIRVAYNTNPSPAPAVAVAAPVASVTAPVAPPPAPKAAPVLIATNSVTAPVRDSVMTAEEVAQMLGVAPPSPTASAKPAAAGEAAHPFMVAFNGASPPSPPSVPFPVLAPDPRPMAPSAPVTSQSRLVNPFKRDLELTLSLSFNRRELGELPVTLTRDNRVIVHSPEFLALISPLLNDVGRKSVADALVGHPGFEPNQLKDAGVALEYDATALAVVVLRIAPDKRVTQALFPGANDPAKRGAPPPAFSAYVNTNVITSYTQGAGLQPLVNLDGAIHYGHLVFESEIQAGNNVDLTTIGANSGYSVERHYARLVYDQPDDFRRFYLGDLDPEIRGDQGYVQMGGIGVARERRFFDSFQSAVLTGNRDLLLQHDATVDILRNGQLYKQIHLDAGSYNLNNLPLQVGSNNVQLQIHDITGQVQTLNYNAYLDPINLRPGDYEYGAYFGVTADNLFTTPHYTNDLAFTGFFRKAFLNHPAIGVGIQASQQVQMGNLQTQFVLPDASRLELEGAASNSDFGGQGGAATIAYERVIDRGGQVDGFSAQLTYTTPHFATLGNIQAFNSAAWQAAVTYTHAFNINWNASIDATYTSQRGPLSDGYSVQFINDYRFDRHWTVRAGVEYEKTGFNGSNLNGFGVNFALVWQPAYDRRADARYDSRLQTESVSYTKSPENRANTFGYSALAEHDPTNTSVSGEVDYIGNRFDASLSEETLGRDFSSVTGEQITSLRIGSTLAYVDGHFGIGRRISDSFALAYPHDNLGDHQVVIGDDLQQGHYIGRSGPLGAAVGNYLTSYIDQSVHYDVLNPPAGYDIGPGVERVHPWYRSGYAIQVGVDAYVSATGTLVGENNKPVALAGGRIVAVNDSTVKQQSFFTNSVGRFAIQSLKPGVHYRVELYSQTPASFEFDVPKASDSLLNLKTVTVPIAVD